MARSRSGPTTAHPAQRSSPSTLGFADPSSKAAPVISSSVRAMFEAGRSGSKPVPGQLALSVDVLAASEGRQPPGEQPPVGHRRVSRHVAEQFLRLGLVAGGQGLEAERTFLANHGFPRGRRSPLGVEDGLVGRLLVQPFDCLGRAELTLHFEGATRQAHGHQDAATVSVCWSR